MVTGVVVAPAGNCRRTPQARVTEQPWGVTRKLSKKRGTRAERQGTLVWPGRRGRQMCSSHIPTNTCPNLRSAIAWAFLEPGICLHKGQVTVRMVMYLHPLTAWSCPMPSLPGGLGGAGEASPRGFPCSRTKGASSSSAGRSRSWLSLRSSRVISGRWAKPVGTEVRRLLCRTRSRRDCSPAAGKFLA